MPEHVSHTWSGDSAWIRPDGVVLDFGTDGTHMGHVVDNPRLFVFKDGKTTFADFMASRPGNYDWGSEEVYRLLFSHGYVRLGKNYAYGAHTRRAANAIWDFFSKHYHRDKDRVFHIELGSGNDAWLRVEQILGGALFDLVESRSFRALVEWIFESISLYDLNGWVSPKGVFRPLDMGESHTNCLRNMLELDRRGIKRNPELPKVSKDLIEGDDVPLESEFVRNGWLRITQDTIVIHGNDKSRRNLMAWLATSGLDHDSRITVVEEFKDEHWTSGSVQQALQGTFFK